MHTFLKRYKEGNLVGAIQCLQDEHLGAVLVVHECSAKAGNAAARLRAVAHKAFQERQCESLCRAPSDLPATLAGRKLNMAGILKDARGTEISGSRSRTDVPAPSGEYRRAKSSGEILKCHLSAACG